MIKKIHITKDFALPLELVTMRTAIYGDSGSGKTTFARLLAELAHAAGQRFGAIDLKNDWYGVKSSADGKSEGMPVVIFGGPHADVQLVLPDAPGSAAHTAAVHVVADTVASIDQSFIIDLDAMSRRKQETFLAAFLDRLYDVNRKTLLLICDEADRYAPQKPMTQDAIMSLSSSEDIARRGRKRGIGSCWITQRTTVLNKNVSELANLLVIFRTPGSKDLKELEDRVGRVADRETVREVMRQAPALEDGQAFFLSAHPKLRQFLPDPIRPIQCPMPATFDSSATPAVGQRKREPKVLARTDLAAIEERMKLHIEQAKADDPRELRKELAALKKQLAAAERAGSAASTAAPKPKIVEVPVIKPAELKRIESAKELMIRELASVRDTIDAGLAKLVSGSAVNKAIERLTVVDDIAKRAAGLVHMPVRPLERPITNHAATARDVHGSRKITGRLAGTDAVKADFRTSVPHAGVREAPAISPAGGDGDFNLRPIHQRILDALAWWETIDVRTPNRNQVAWLAGSESASGGYFSRAIGELKTAGLLIYPQDKCVQLTDAGRACASEIERPKSEADLYARIRGVLSGIHKSIFNAMLKAEQEGCAELTREQLGERLGKSESGGYFARAIGELKTMGIITYPTKGTVALSELITGITIT